MANADNQEAPSHDENQCFSDKYKKGCACYVFIMSFLLFILAIVLGAYGYFSVGGRSFNPKVGSYGVKWTIDANAALGILCIAGGVCALVLSIIGFFVQGCTHWFFAIPYAILSFIAAILAFAFGAAVLGGDFTTQVKDTLCKNPTVGAAYLRRHYNAYVDQKMCSADCKCTGTNKAAWEQAQSSNT